MPTVSYRIGSRHELNERFVDISSWWTYALNFESYGTQCLDKVSLSVSLSLCECVCAHHIHQLRSAADWFRIVKQALTGCSGCWCGETVTSHTRDEGASVWSPQRRAATDRALCFSRWATSATDCMQSAVEPRGGLQHSGKIYCLISTEQSSSTTQ